MASNSWTKTVMRKSLIFPTLFFSCYVTQLSAEQILSCQFGYEDQFLPISTSSTNDSEQSEVDVKAEQVQVLESGTSVFKGNVDVTRAGQQLNAERVTYNKNTGDVTANGAVSIRDSDMVIESDRAEWSTVHDEGRMLDAEYHIRQKHARGEATHLLRQGQLRTKMKNATYTTCPEGSNAWQLKADKVYLDHEAAVGEAKDVVLRIGNIPVLYTPYINFPLSDERKSGFLIPSIGVTDETGFDFTQPYYWNIAPNLDATLTPRYMSERGLMLKGEFRYMFENSEGDLNASYLNSDDYLGDDGDANPYYNQSREIASWQHITRFSPSWRAKIDYNYASDRNYFEDFGSSLNLTSTTHLKRMAQTVYTADTWKMIARVQGYQSLGDASKPYKRLPQLLFSSYLPEQKNGFTYSMNVEFVEFDHDTRVDGQRINIEPAVSLPLGNSAMFITPRLALSHSQYNLQNDINNRYDDSANRTVPITSIDSGLFFDRNITIAGSRYIHTLEPRAFYLYVPKREQSDIPLFDTAESTFNMVRLFSYDRFTGKDRIGDSNQLSLAVTSRIIDDNTGKEKLSVTLGQIRYFSDREVTLPGQVEETSSHSDLVAEAVAYINNNWSVDGQYQWDTTDSQTSLSAISIKYRGDNGGIINLSHRYRAENLPKRTQGLEQIDVSALWPMNERWKWFGRWYHSVEDGRTLEKLAGLQYDSCCWATRFMVRDYVNDVNDNQSNLAIFFQIELKGLGTLGNKTDDLLARSIRGFDDERY